MADSIGYGDKMRQMDWLYWEREAKWTGYSWKNSPTGLVIVQIQMLNRLGILGQLG